MEYIFCYCYPPHFNLSHHTVLKEHLQAATLECGQLKQTAADLEEKAEHLRYELADAHEAAKSRDEIVMLLQKQISYMESTHALYLEDAEQNKLRIANLEQEVVHLRKICHKYEEEKLQLQDIIEQKDKAEKTIESPIAEEQNQQLPSKEMREAVKCSEAERHGYKDEMDISCEEDLETKLNASLIKESDEHIQLCTKLSQQPTICTDYHCENAALSDCQPEETEDVFQLQIEMLLSTECKQLNLKDELTNTTDIKTSCESSEHKVLEYKNGLEYAENSTPNITTNAVDIPFYHQECIEKNEMQIPKMSYKEIPEVNDSIGKSSQIDQYTEINRNEILSQFLELKELLHLHETEVCKILQHFIHDSNLNKTLDIISSLTEIKHKSRLLCAHMESFTDFLSSNEKMLIHEFVDCSTQNSVINNFDDSGNKILVKEIVKCDADISSITQENAILKQEFNLKCIKLDKLTSTMTELAKENEKLLIYMAYMKEKLNQNKINYSDIQERLNLKSEFHAGYEVSNKQSENVVKTESQYTQTDDEKLKAIISENVILKCELHKAKIEFEELEKELKGMVLPAESNLHIAQLTELIKTDSQVCRKNYSSNSLEASAGFLEQTIPCEDLCNENLKLKSDLNTVKGDKNCLFPSDVQQTVESSIELYTENKKDEEQDFGIIPVTTDGSEFYKNETEGKNTKIGSAFEYPNKEKNMHDNNENCLTEKAKINLASDKGGTRNGVNSSSKADHETPIINACSTEINYSSQKIGLKSDLEGIQQLEKVCVKNQSTSSTIVDVPLDNNDYCEGNNETMHVQKIISECITETDKEYCTPDNKSCVEHSFKVTDKKNCERAEKCVENSLSSTNERTLSNEELGLQTHTKTMKCDFSDMSCKDGNKNLLHIRNVNESVITNQVQHSGISCMSSENKKDLCKFMIMSNDACRTEDKVDYSSSDDSINDTLKSDATESLVEERTSETEIRGKSAPSNNFKLDCENIIFETSQCDKVLKSPKEYLKYDTWKRNLSLYGKHQKINQRRSDTSTSPMGSSESDSEPSNKNLADRSVTPVECVADTNYVCFHEDSNVGASEGNFEVKRTNSVKSKINNNSIAKASVKETYGSNGCRDTNYIMKEDHQYESKEKSSTNYSSSETCSSFPNYKIKSSNTGSKRERVCVRQSRIPTYVKSGNRSYGSSSSIVYPKPTKCNKICHLANTNKVCTSVTSSESAKDSCLKTTAKYRQDAATNTSLYNSELQRELQIERERVRKHAVSIRRLKSELQLMKNNMVDSKKGSKPDSNALTARQRSSSSSAPHSPHHYVFTLSEFQKQVNELEQKVKEEHALRFSLEVQVNKMRFELQEKFQLEKELSLLQNRLDKDFVSKAEIENIKRNYEAALSLAKKAAEHTLHDDLSNKLYQITNLIEKQECAHIEYLKNSNESHMKQEFQDTRIKLLSDLARIQATLQEKGEKEKEWKEKCEKLAKECEKKKELHRKKLIEKSYNLNLTPYVSMKEKDLNTKTSMLNICSAIQPQTLCVQSLNTSTQNDTWTTDKTLSQLLRRELEKSIRKHTAIDPDQSSSGPSMSSPDRHTEILRKKYLMD